MPRGWRIPALCSVVVLLSLLFRVSDLDVVSGRLPDGVRLVYPAGHVIFAPFTLLADYLNGGSVGDLKGFAVWSVLAFVLWRLLRRGDGGSGRELRATAIGLLCLSLFVWWGARWRRPIPRLVAADSALIIFDTHSHTSISHDGRRGFGAAQNAEWHYLAGFDAAFVTDHNAVGGAHQWQHDRAGRPPRLLPGEELSLSGLHMIVLGVDTLIRNVPGNTSFDSSLALIARIRDAFVIASLPEYARYHWGPDLGRLIAAGTGGLEIWTTSPKAMQLAPSRRREIAGRARSLGIPLVGATDMHGLGWAATVWNVTRLPGWEALTDSALAERLIDRLRTGGDSAVTVVARRRSLPGSRLGQAFAIPCGAWTLLRSASLPHVAALLAWCWVPWLVSSRRRRRTA